VILRSEDSALLMGIILIFAALVFVMPLTCNLDWYRVSERIGITHRMNEPLLDA
jgi:inner membrane protein involved in colicin E2 resistance